ncbi:MAG: carboxypeptidase-like regulatory domain-containing protein [Vicinamibacterales bacterium]
MRIAVMMLSVIVALGALPPPSAWAAANVGLTQQTATIEGAAHDSSGKPLANRPVQARNVQTGQVAASIRTDANGRFRFADLPAATYVVELLNDARRTVGTSIEIPLTTVPHAFVTVCAAADRVTPTTWWRTTPAVLAAAGAVGITAAVVRTRDDASPVR